MTLIGSCDSGRTAAGRHTIIDSRDEYDPRSLDPALSTDVPTGRAVAYLFDGLTAFDAEAHVLPALAERWEISPDGLRYTFHLRHGVRFHDGGAFSSRNVVLSWQRVLDPKAQSGRGEPLYPIRGAREFQQGKAQTIAGLTAPDDSTVAVELTEPLSVFVKLLAMPVAAIVPATTPADFGEHPIGTGPWKLVEWKHDDYLLFARNPNYWGKQPGADSLRARIIAEPSTAVAEYESGNVDVLRIPADEAREWTDDESRKPQLRSTPSLQLWYIGLNTTRGPLRDARVRQAINHAIDVDRIIERLIGGRGIRANGVIPPSLAGHDSTRRPYAFDQAAARRLLAEAGFPNGIDLDLWCSNAALTVRVAQTIQAYLTAVGIRTRIVQREAAAARAAARKGESDMILKDWFADYPDAENFLFPLLHSANKGSGGNVSFFADAQVDSVITLARREADDAKRVVLYKTADSLAYSAAPLVPLYFYIDLYAVQPWITGFDPPVIFNGQRWLGVSISRPSASVKGSATASDPLLVRR